MSRLRMLQLLAYLVALGGCPADAPTARAAPELRWALTIDDVRAWSVVATRVAVLASSARDVGSVDTSIPWSNVAPCRLFETVRWAEFEKGVFGSTSKRLLLIERQGGDVLVVWVMYFGGELPLYLQVAEGHVPLAPEAHRILARVAGAQRFSTEGVPGGFR